MCGRFTLRTPAASWCQMFLPELAPDALAIVASQFDLQPRFNIAPTQMIACVGRDDVAVVITTGGTGISRRDNTIDIVRRLLTAELDGFGELFRMLSYEQIGSAAMLSRSVAGLVNLDTDDETDSFLFALPGSTKAVELAMEKLIVPELPHLVWQRH